MDTRIKKLLLKHGLIALICAFIYFSLIDSLSNSHFGIDSIGEAIVIVVFVKIVQLTFIANIIFFIVRLITQILSPKGKIILSGFLLVTYCVIFIILCINLPPNFIRYLSMREFFSVIYLGFVIINISAFIIRVIILIKQLEEYKNGKSWKGDKTLCE